MYNYNLFLRKQARNRAPNPFCNGIRVRVRVNYGHVFNVAEPFKRFKIVFSDLDQTFLLLEQLGVKPPARNPLERRIDRNI